MLKGDRRMSLTLTGVFSDWVAQRWDMIRIAQEYAVRAGYP